jgi:3D (Asp-Asp-Asp) domain-containing protein
VLTPRRAVAIISLGAVFAAVPLRAEPHEKISRALVTFYWIIDESSSHYKGKRTSELRDVHGNVLAYTYHRFKLDLVREGTGWLKDGRTVMFEKKVNGESRFRITSSKYGLSSNGCPLVPFRTIAVDPHVIRIGSRVYVPQLKGMVLPDGTTHDGMFIAADRGHFRGKHLDFFIGAGTRGVRPFYRKGYGSRSRVTVHVEGPADGCKP